MHAAGIDRKVALRRCSDEEEFFGGGGSGCRSCSTLPMSLARESGRGCGTTKASCYPVNPNPVVVC